MNRRVGVSLGLTAIVLLMLVLGFGLFGAGGHDDSHITVWAAHALLNYGDVLNYNGERLEQSSSLLHVLVLALLGWVTGGNLVTLSYSLGIACGAACLPWLYAQLRGYAGAAVWGAVAWLASSVFFVYWSFGGLDASLAALMLAVLGSAWLAWLNGRLTGLIAPGVLVLLTWVAAWARPETPLVILAAVTAVTGVMVWQPEARRRAGTLWSWTVVGVALSFGLRWGWFGAWFPQPVAAKAGFRSLGGVGYVLSMLMQPATALLLLLGMIVVLRSAWQGVFRGDRLLLVASAWVTAQAGFVLFSSGDWMEGYRFWVPVLPWFAVCLGAQLMTLFCCRWLGVLSMSVVLGLNGWLADGFVRKKSMGLLWPVAQHYQEVSPLQSRRSFFEYANREHLRDLMPSRYLQQLTGQLLSRHSAPVVVMTGQMGLLPYDLSRRYFRQVRFVDRYALTEVSLLACEQAGKVRLSHHGGLGKQLTLERYLEKRVHLRRECGISYPDVIADLYFKPSYNALLKEAGYRLVFLQRGQVYGGSEQYHGRWTRAFFFVAVREPLARQFHLTRMDRNFARDWQLHQVIR